MNLAKTSATVEQLQQTVQELKNELALERRCNALLMSRLELIQRESQAPYLEKIFLEAGIELLSHPSPLQVRPAPG